LTGAAVVDLLITDLAVFGIERGGGATLLEMAPGTSLEEIRAKTEAGFR
jgi:acyl CoA:acetate/3-ketoacid CoA transferase beta subunit